MPHLKIRIQNPEVLVWEGEALSLSSENSMGPFDILPYHARFISVIEDRPIRIRLPGGEEKVFTFPRALISLSKDMVFIYTGL